MAWTIRDSAEIMLGNWLGHGQMPSGLVEDVLLFAKLYGPSLATDKDSDVPQVSPTDWAAKAREATTEG